MKKFLCLLTIVLGFCLLGFNNVYAADDEGTALFIFDEGQTSVSCNANTNVCTSSSSHAVHLGDTRTLEARTCSFADATVEGDSAVISKSDCTLVVADWSTSDSSIASVASGVVTVNNFGSATITATASELSRSYSLTFTEAEPTTPDTPVNPDTPTTDWYYKRLFVIDSDTTKVTYDGTVNGPKIEKMLSVGSTMQLSTIICSDRDAEPVNGVRTWNVSQCTPVSATWSTTPDSAISVSNTGLVKAQTSGFSWDYVYATVDRSQVTLGENESFNNVHNIVVLYAKGAEYKKGKTTTIQKENTFTEDVYTSGNPPTGNKTLYIVPFMITGGSYLVFRKKRIA